MDLTQALQFAIESEDDLVTTLGELIGSYDISSAEKVREWTAKIAGEENREHSVAIRKLALFVSL